MLIDEIIAAPFISLKIFALTADSQVSGVRVSPTTLKTVLM